MATSEGVEYDVEVTTEVTFEDPEMEAALPDRFVDALNLMRYFHRRDEMNAEVHYDPDRRQPGKGLDLVDDFPIAETNVRYSPITIAAERVASYMASLLGADPAKVTALRFTDVLNMGGPGTPTTRGAYLEERLAAKDEALGAAEALWAAVKDLQQPSSPLKASPFDVDARIGNLTKAMEDFEEAVAEAKKADTEVEVIASDAARCTYVARETNRDPSGMSWTTAGNVCGWNKEAAVHVQDEHREPWQHVWRHETKKEH